MILVNGACRACVERAAILHNRNDIYTVGNIYKRYTTYLLYRSRYNSYLVQVINDIPFYGLSRRIIYCMYRIAVVDRVWVTSDRYKL